MTTKKSKEQEKEHMTLSEYFKKYGTPQRFLAKKTGISPTALNSILKGKNLPTLRTAWLIEKATDGIVTLYDWELDLAVNEQSNIRKSKK